MGDGNLVSNISLGGSSKHFGVKSAGLERVAIRAVQGLGLPGSSSHRNGTEAEEWSGGVSIPGRSGEFMGGIENSGSFGVELNSGSASDPMFKVFVGAFSLPSSTGRVKSLS